MDDFMIKNKSRYKRNSDLNPYSLHEMIRDERTYPQFAAKIKKFDALVQTNMNMVPRKDLSSDEKKQYRRAIKVAKMEVLSKAEVILCTCHASCGPIVRRSTRIKQVRPYRVVILFI